MGRRCRVGPARERPCSKSGSGVISGRVRLTLLLSSATRNPSSLVTTSTLQVVKTAANGSKVTERRDQWPASGGPPAARASLHRPGTELPRTTAPAFVTSSTGAGRFPARRQEHDEMRAEEEER